MMTPWSQFLQSRLLKKGGIYLFSSWISQGVMLLTWIVLPWKLPAIAVGQFALVSFVIDFMTRIILMGMDSAILRFYVEKDRRAEFLRAACTWVGAGFVVAAFALWATRGLVPELIKGLAPIYGHVVWLALATAAATALATVVFTHFVACGEAPRYGKLTILRSGLLAVGYLLAAWLGLGVSGLVGSQLVASLVIAATFFRPGSFRRPASGLDKRAMGEMAAYGMPMTVYAIFSLTSDYTGRLFLDRQVTLANLGVFQFYYQIANQVNGIWSSLNRAWTPHVFQILHADRPSALNQIVRACALSSAIYASGLAIGVLAGMAGVWKALIPPAYYLQINLFYILLLGPLFCCIYTAVYPVFYFKKNTVRVSAIQTLACVVTILMTIYATMTWRVNGAALSWVLGLFITPFLYMAGFPELRGELRPVGAILFVWGLAGALVFLALHSLDSRVLAVGALVAAAAAMAARHIKAAPGKTPLRT